MMRPGRRGLESMSSPKGERMGSRPTDIAAILGFIVYAFMAILMLSVVGLGFGLFYFLTH